MKIYSVLYSLHHLQVERCGMPRKAIVFLGAGQLQFHAISAAKNNGFLLIGFDRSRAASSRVLLDEFFEISGSATDQIIKILSTFRGIEIASIWANNDVFIKTRAILEEIFLITLPHLNLDQCTNLLDKSLFKKKYPSDLYIENYDPSQLHSYDDLILKPAIGSGSVGIHFLPKEKSLIQIPPGFVLEHYQKGVEFGLNCFASDNFILWFNSVRRFFNHKKDFEPRGTFYSESIENSPTIKRIKVLLQEYILDNRLKGPIKFDILLTPQNVVKIIEIAPRFHGELDTSYVFNFAGINSIPNLYFKSLAVFGSINMSHTPGKRGKFGYMSVIDKSLDKNSLNSVSKYAKKFNINFRIKKEISSQIGMSNIKQYLFFESNDSMTDHIFMDISNFLNETTS